MTRKRTLAVLVLAVMGTVGIASDAHAWGGRSCFGRQAGCYGVSVGCYGQTTACYGVPSGCYGASSCYGCSGSCSGASSCYEDCQGGRRRTRAGRRIRHASCSCTGSCFGGSGCYGGSSCTGSCFGGSGCTGSCSGCYGFGASSSYGTSRYGTTGTTRMTSSVIVAQSVAPSSSSARVHKDTTSQNVAAPKWSDTVAVAAAPQRTRLTKQVPEQARVRSAVW